MGWTRVEGAAWSVRHARVSLLSPGPASRPLRRPPPSNRFACCSPATCRQPKAAAPPARQPEATSHLASVFVLPESQKLLERRSHGGGGGVDVDPAQPGDGSRRPRGPGQVTAAPQLADNLHPQGPDLVPCAPFRCSSLAATFHKRMCCTSRALLAVRRMLLCFRWPDLCVFCVVFVRALK
jgi:hypothetical protein